MKDHLRFSEIPSWLNCRMAHHFSYEEKIEPIRLRVRLALGSAIHKGFEAFWKKEQSLESAIDEYCDAIECNSEEEKAERENIRELSKRLVVKALVWMKPDEYEVVLLDGKPLIEFSLDVPMDNFKSFGGTVDVVLRERATGACWLVDYKSKEVFDAEDADRHNLQFTVYQYLLAQKGVNVVGSKMFEIRTVEPREPSLNKDGSVSKKPCITTWEIFKAAVLNAGGNPDDYSKMKAKLEGQKFFRFVDTYRTFEHCERVYDNIVRPVAREIAAGAPPIPVMNKFKCKSCEFEQLCMAKLHPDADEDWIRSTQYKKRGLPVLEVTK